MRKILVIDNYDSFVYNIINLILENSDALVHKVFNDKIDFAKLYEYDSLVLSPGPGLPQQAGLLMQCLHKCANTHKILGICLGHQAICEYYGGSLVQLHKIQHGHKAEISVTDSNDPLFKYMPGKFNAALYNSWTSVATSMPSVLKISSVDENGNIMSVYHKSLPLFGLQFHPESVISNCSRSIINAFIEL